jgi:hypothetical protein
MKFVPVCDIQTKQLVWMNDKGEVFSAVKLAGYFARQGIK